MADYPRDYRGRLAERLRIQRAANAEAERKAVRTGRSLKCSGYDSTVPPKHAGAEGGCRNDGTGCICTCHDPAPES